MEAIASDADDYEDQDVEEELNSLLGKEMYKKFYKKIKSDLRKVGKCSSDHEGEQVDKMKFKKLIAEYKNFKRNNVQHFKFNPASEQKAYGEHHLLSTKKLNLFF